MSGTHTKKHRQSVFLQASGASLEENAYEYSRIYAGRTPSPAYFENQYISQRQSRIKLYEKDHGILILWETLTTNLTGIRPDHCAFINIKAADGLFPAWLSDNHLAEPTGQILESNGCLYPEYLFYGKELDALDHEGHTLYIRHQKGELGRRFERLYLALRRWHEKSMGSATLITAAGGVQMGFPPPCPLDRGV